MSQGAAIALLVCASLPATARASDLRHHRMMTDQALRHLGWTDEAAIAITADYSQSTDLGRIPDYTVRALQFGLPRSASQVPSVRSLAETASFNESGTRGFHFSGLYRFRDIALRWEELDTWAHAVATRIGSLPTADRDRLRPILFGLVAHAVQDFYCHSNWVGVLERQLPPDLESAELPLWEELTGEDDTWRAAHPDFPALAALRAMMTSDTFRSSNEEEGGLQTGKPRVVDLGEEAPWGHRHKGGREMEIVHELGTRATARWIARLDGMIQAEDGSLRLVAER